MNSKFRNSLLCLGILLLACCLQGCNGRRIPVEVDIQGPDMVGEYSGEIFTIETTGSNPDWEWYCDPPRAGRFHHLPEDWDGGVPDGIFIYPMPTYSPPSPKVAFWAHGVPENTVVTIGVIVTSYMFDPIIRTKEITVVERGLSVWANTWGGSGVDSSSAVAADEEGNTYVTGIFSDTIDLDPGPPSVIQTSQGVEDVYLIKMDKNGEYEWGITWGGEFTQDSSAIALDRDGYIYVTGNYSGPTDFDPGPGVSIQEGLADVFLCKFDPNGQFCWVQTWGGAIGFDSGNALAVGDDGIVYVTGFWSYVAYEADDINWENPIVKHDFFLKVYDMQGYLLISHMWSENVAENSVGNGIDIDDRGNIYICGEFSGTLDFDPGPGADIITSNNSKDSFLCKFNSSYEYQWARIWGGDSDDEARHMEIHGDVLYIAGEFEDTIDLDPGPGVDEYASNGEEDVYIAKFDIDGNYIWGGTWGWYKADSVSGVALDEAGNISVAGKVFGSVDFDPGPYDPYYETKGMYSVYMNRFKPDGQYIWTYTIGTDEGITSGGVAVDGYGNAFITGAFEGEINLNAGLGLDYHESIGGYDAFISKIPPEEFDWLLPKYLLY